jgi:threonine dehydratase/serine racemase
LRRSTPGATPSPGGWNAEPEAGEAQRVPGIDDVRDAAGRIGAFARRTPVATCSTLDGLCGRALHLKCELFQKTGSFKFRGACNAVMKLPADLAARGVITHSSGNHAQALAKAAALRGCACDVVMPRTAAPVKRRAVVGYGAALHECEPTLAAREAAAAEILRRGGGTLLPPYDHPDVIAGQGTAALELLEEVPDLDCIVAPVGGGGLISGTCIVAREAGVRVFAAEPAGADDAARSKAAGRLVPQTGPSTICDGLLTSLGGITWPFVRDVVERVLTVPDDRIVEAMRLLWERAKLLVEPSAAVALAVVLSQEFRALEGLGRVGVILSGGNADLDRLPWR